MNFYELLFNRGQPSGEGMTHFERLFAAKLAGGGGEIKELEGVPPLLFKANGEPLIDWIIYGNMVQNGTPTPDNPVMPEGCGDLETVGAKAGQYKIPISSANTTTPVYLGEVESTRRIRKLVLTGGDDENWNITNNTKVLYLAVSGFLKEQGTICYCTHYETVNNVSSTDDVNDGECTFNDHLNWLYIKDSNYTSAQGFKNYLAAQYAAGTPVTVWYVLATPETGIVNEPVRKIGNYADTLSMEQAGVEIPTIKGNNTLDIDTTLKPSNVYIKYKT